MPDFYGLPESLRQTVALHVLALWRYDDSDSLASDYLSMLLNDLTKESKRSRILNTLPTLQMPLTETNEGKIIHTVFYPNGQAMERVHGYMGESGDLIRDGVWERWRPNGNREIYGYFAKGEHHGRRFEWDRDGKLMGIEEFNRGQLSEYSSENLDRHEAFQEAQRLFTSEETETLSPEHD